HNVAALFTHTVHQINRIHDDVLQLRRPVVTGCQGFFVADFVHAVIVLQGEVVVFHHFFQLVSEFRLVQVAHAQAATGYFVFVSRADTTTGGTDFGVATLEFAGLIQRAVVRQNQRTGVG